MNFQGYAFNSVGDGVHFPVRQWPIKLPDGRAKDSVAKKYYAKRGNQRRLGSIGSHVIESNETSLPTRAGEMSQMGRGKKKKRKQAKRRV